MEFKNLEETLELIGQLARDQYKDKLKTGKPYNSIATGKLFNSIDYRVDLTNNGIKLSFVDLPDYYIYVENGRKPGGKMPPISIIKKWIKDRGIPNKPGLEYIIARSIGENGIKPKPYIREIKITLKNYIDEIEDAITKDIAQEIKTKLNKTKNDNNK